MLMLSQPLVLPLPLRLLLRDELREPHEPIHDEPHELVLNEQLRELLNQTTADAHNKTWSGYKEVHIRTSRL